MNGEILLVALMTIFPTDNDRLDHTNRVVHQICVTTHSDREVMALLDDTNQKREKKNCFFLTRHITHSRLKLPGV
ncbi:hypothetical protein GHT06_019794 [Daphnia sinensis]|uniref:Uncharacterized protein n=1 Tax=Daphnia sinensis TaxID=1820382 RepID=A0AAD5PNY1_9CRUS|nr:hypothetical protein GHT06_019794 [Daphnia sinensis]